MPYVPKFPHLFKILFRIRDAKAAEGLWFMGSLLHDEGDFKAARDAFNHSKLLDPQFAGAFYNYAAMTEKLTGKSPEAIAAWKAYVAVAQHDKRQVRALIDKVREHIQELEQGKT